MLGIQILKRIQTLHENNFIHRDIKPENFTIGLKKMNNIIYMIDYGLTRKYCDSHKNHIPYKEGKILQEQLCMLLYILKKEQNKAEETIQNHWDT